MVNSDLSNTTIDLAGRVDLKKIMLIDGSSKERALSLFGVVHELNLYEDLYSPYVTGTITITEAYNLIESVPLLGEEKLVIEYCTPGLPNITKIFFITKVDNRTLESDKKHTYVLHFVSDKMLIDLVTGISKAFNATGSEVVEKVYTGYLGSKDSLQIQDSFNRFKFIANYWRPMKCISYAASRSMLDDVYTSPNFLFFETLGYHRFASISTMMGQPTYTSYTFDKRPLRAEDASGGTVRDFETEYSVIKKLEFVSSFDTLEQVKNGTINHKVLGYNLMRKTPTFHHVNYMKDFDKSGHLEKFPLHSPEFNLGNTGKFSYKITSSHLHDGFTTDDTDAILSKRIPLLGQLEMFKLNITVAGRSDITIGMTVDLIIPNYKRLDKDEGRDNKSKYFSGKYLITAIMHRITQSRHEQIIEIVKDSVVNKIEFGETF